MKTLLEGIRLMFGRPKSKRYYRLEEMVEMIDQPNRSACRRFLEKHHEALQVAYGSLGNHHAWKGGYLNHVTETMNIGVQIYRLFNSMRPLPFSLSDVLVSLFWHDAENYMRIFRAGDGKLRTRGEFQKFSDRHTYRMKVLEECGAQLSAEQENAIRYANGELDDYSPIDRAMSPLAAMVHMCDAASSRIWYDRPLSEGEVWGSR